MAYRQRFTARPVALLLSGALAMSPLVACSSHSDPPPPVDDTVRGGGAPAATPDKPGMSTRSKVVVLAGAAALYYLYKHHKAAATPEGPDGQYYLSKNGRVYYRDAEHRAHWVTAPPAGIQVPAAEAAEYQELQGYDNRTTGRDLVGMGSDSESP
jgi:hypothetical protein